MKINTSSLHYKFNRFMNMSTYDRPKTVCSYFWTTVFNALAALFMSGFLLFFMTFILSPILCLLFNNNKIYEMAPAALIIEGLLLTWGIGSYFYSKISFGHVAKEYFKAVKNKWCPLITYEEDKHG